MFRPWAFWRRVQYATGVSVFGAVCLTGLYFMLFYQSPTCFDGRHNGDERGVDCGGACVLICPFDVLEPTVRWSRSFEISKGIYNAVAYVENQNKVVGTKSLQYTFTLLDEEGDVITEKRGITFLPPDSVYPIFEGRIETGDRIPIKTFITLTPNPAWEAFANARDQFTITNRALSGVDSKPRLDAMIQNTTIEDARDVEVVATIFDAKGTALTASRTVVPLFQARVEKKVTFSWPEPIAKTLRSCEVPSDVILAIDLSGSMNDDGGTPPQPVTSVLTAASAFGGRLRSGDQLGVVTFATNAALARPLSKDITAMGIAITNLRINPKDERGGTNIGDAIIQATTEFSTIRHNADGRKVLVLFTDGKANEPGEDGEAYARTAADAAKRSGITVFTIGLGSNLNKEFLTELATDPALRYLASDTKSLDAIYRSISTAICEDGPAVIDIVPKVIGDLNDGR